MLRTLHIENLGLVEKTTLELIPGLNVVTGQSGAGKSLLLASLAMVLGQRSGAALQRLLRATPDGPVAEGGVTAVFELDAITPASDCRTAGEADPDGHGPGLAEFIGDDGTLLLARRVFATGRSSCSINGRPVNAETLRGVGRQLVELLGQHESLRLNERDYQLQLVDRAAGCTALADAYRQRYSAWRQRVGQWNQLREQIDLRRQRAELYRFHLHEIERVGPTPGELAAMTREQKALAASTRLVRELAAVLRRLEGGDTDCVSDKGLDVTSELRASVNHLRALAPMGDDELRRVSEGIAEHATQLEGYVSDLQNYAHRLSVDEERVDLVEQRLDALHRLDHRLGRTAEDTLSAYGIDVPDREAMATLVRYRDWLSEQLSTMDREEGDIETLAEHIAADELRLRRDAQELSQLRREASDGMERRVGEELAELGMTEARFVVNWSTRRQRDGSDNDTPALGPDGCDDPVFMLQANPGSPARPLRDVASGGELSRVLLSIRAVMSESSRQAKYVGVDPVMVFDEVDANIGGRLGGAIAAKLRTLAGHRQGGAASPKISAGQVICVTHLPQIAAAGDRHFRVTKRTNGQGHRRDTTTTIEQLNGDDRIDEIAAMLVGDDAEISKHAAVSQAREWLGIAERRVNETKGYRQTRHRAKQSANGVAA